MGHPDTEAPPAKACGGGMAPAAASGRRGAPGDTDPDRSVVRTGATAAPAATATMETTPLWRLSPRPREGRR